ncbi:hypothetical protein ABFX02_14G114800 [Erythranthe guttata]
MPSTHFTGGYRVCSYLDPSEPKHAILKSFFLSFLSRAHKSLIPTFRSSVGHMFVDLEEELAVKGQAEGAGFNAVSDKMSFDFLFRLFGDGKSSYETSVGGGGNGNLDKWLLFQLAPLVTLGLKWLPNFLEDFVLHTFPLPFWAVKSGYEKVHDAFRDAAVALLDEAAKTMSPVIISKDEATHNLLFLTGFNAYGGMKVLFPALLKYIGAAGEDLHRRLAAEIRAVVKEEGGKVTLAAVNKMSLTKSVAWEVMRIEPPVAYQFGRAKHDITVASHTAAFVIKRGEMICGYQPFATKDPEIFESPEDFVADRFVGEEGEKLIKYVLWSNGREDEDPTAANKQCPAKDMVVLLARMMVVEFFLKYDTFTVESGTLLLGTSVTVKSLTNATW